MIPLAENAKGYLTFLLGSFVSYRTGTGAARKCSPHLKDLLLLILVVDLNCDVCAGLFSAAARCFPRARLQPPRETHSAGSSDTCSSRGSQRSSAPNNHRISNNNDKK